MSSLSKHQDPLFRFFEREVKMGGKMLQEVRQDLSDVVQVCEGKKKQTNYLRTLISDLVKGKISLFHFQGFKLTGKSPQT